MIIYLHSLTCYENTNRIVMPAQLAQGFQNIRAPWQNGQATMAIHLMMKGHLHKISVQRARLQVRRRLVLFLWDTFPGLITCSPFLERLVSCFSPSALLFGSRPQKCGWQHEQEEREAQGTDAEATDHEHPNFPMQRGEEVAGKLICPHSSLRLCHPAPTQEQASETSQESEDVKQKHVQRAQVCR